MRKESPIREIATSKERQAVINNLQRVLDKGGVVFLWRGAEVCLVKSLDRATATVFVPKHGMKTVAAFPATTITAFGRRSDSYARIIYDGDFPSVAFGRRNGDIQTKAVQSPLLFSRDVFEESKRAG